MVRVQMNKNRERLVYRAIETGDITSLKRQFRVSKKLVYSVPRSIGIAVRCNDVNTVKLLLRIGIPINTGNSYAMVIASDLGNLGMLELLLTKGIKVNVRRNYAINRAVVLGRFDIVKLLVKHGATVDCSTVELAEEYRQQEIVEYLSGFLTDSYYAELDKYCETFL